MHFYWITASCILLSLLVGCGGGGGESSTSANSTPTAANEMRITVEKWSGNKNYPNQGYVSLEICEPSTSNCQTIDHVLVDTGSYGLRLMSAAVNLSLPQITISDNQLAECTHFVSGYTWGPVVRASVTLGSQVVPTLPIQLINASYAQIPAACSSGGTQINTASALGANGILGIGSFQHDCPACATQARAGHYYICSSLPCTSTAVPLASQVANPVAALSSNNNGVVINLPSVSPTGQASASGLLVFGIGTSSNNTISSETIFDLDSSGYLTTTYRGITYSQSYIDTGSNGIFFTDNSLTRCSGSSSFYCANPSISKSAVISSGNISQAVEFEVGTLASVPSGYAALPKLTGIGSSFAWGMPFFYGRKVFVSISGKTTANRTTPIIAF